MMKGGTDARLYTLQISKVFFCLFFIAFFNFDFSSFENFHFKIFLNRSKSASFTLTSIPMAPFFHISKTLKLNRNLTKLI